MWYYMLMSYPAVVNRAEWQQVMWQPQIDGRKHDVPIDVLTGGEFADVHLYGGLGEERHATRVGVETLGGIGLSVAGVVLPFHLLEATRSNIERTCIEVPLLVAQFLNEANSKPVDTRVNLIGKSQGGGVVLQAGYSAPEQYGAIGSLAPVGLNSSFLGENSTEQRRTFLRRLLISNNRRPEQNPFRDKGNLRAGIEVGARALSDVMARRLKTKLDFAIDHDFSKDMIELRANHAVRIFVGEGDPLFRASEIAYNLGLVGCEDLLEVIPGSHGSLLTRMGTRQLEAVGAWISKVKA